MHRLEQARARAPGAQAAQFVLERRVRRLHAAFEFGEVELRQLRHGASHGIEGSSRARAAEAAKKRFAAIVAPAASLA